MRDIVSCFVNGVYEVPVLPLYLVFAVLQDPFNLALLRFLRILALQGDRALLDELVQHFGKWLEPEQQNKIVANIPDRVGEVDTPCIRQGLHSLLHFAGIGPLCPNGFEDLLVFNHDCGLLPLPVER